MILISLIKLLAAQLPKTNEMLKKARMSVEAEDFIKKTLMSASYTSIAIVFIIFMLLAKNTAPVKLILILFISLIISLVVLFFYFLQVPFIKLSKVNKEINKEIVYAGRFLVVELESGVTLYKAMKNLNKSYPVTGAYFNEIINKVNIGTSIEDAVSEAIELSPSDSLTKLLWQISNSLRTGSNIAEPLKTVVETLIKEQQILVNEYGRKLNPLAMFYMLMAIILPSLGVTMLTILAIFIGFELKLTILLLINGVLGFIQFMFIAAIGSIRPPVEL